MKRPFFIILILFTQIMLHQCTTEINDKIIGSNKGTVQITIINVDVPSLDCVLLSGENSSSCSVKTTESKTLNIQIDVSIISVASLTVKWPDGYQHVFNYGPNSSKILKIYNDHSYQ